ncbi:DUF397 domain-containing protein [Streptomyces sp. NPDC001633]|uniref:DUF397 domain-containing protein n=1 Tax=Streptomyces sp. NPDC001633 TaxID=3364595 RepID=UPI0036CBFBA7
MTIPTAPTAAQLAAASWRTSSYSAANNECVEVAELPVWTCIRDSKDPSGPVLRFTAAAFATFVEDVKHSH